jgi:hypothetical protein
MATLIVQFEPESASITNTFQRKRMEVWFGFNYRRSTSFLVASILAHVLLEHAGGIFFHFFAGNRLTRRDIEVSFWDIIYRDFAQIMNHRYFLFDLILTFFKLRRVTTFSRRSTGPVSNAIRRADISSR